MPQLKLNLKHLKDIVQTLNLEGWHKYYLGELFLGGRII